MIGEIAIRSLLEKKGFEKTLLFCSQGGKRCADGVGKLLAFLDHGITAENFNGGIVGSSGGAWNTAYFISGKESMDRCANIYTPHKEYFINQKPYPKLDLDWLCDLSQQNQYYLDLYKISNFVRPYAVVVAKHDARTDVNRIRLLFPPDRVTESQRKLEMIRDCIKASSALQYAYNKTVQIGKDAYWDIRPYEMIPIKDVVSNPYFAHTENAIVISSYKFPKNESEVTTTPLSTEQKEQAQKLGIPITMVDPSFSLQKLWEAYKFMRDDNLRNYTIFEPCNIEMSNAETDHLKIRNVINTSHQQTSEYLAKIKEVIKSKVF